MERESAMDASALLNDGYRTLRDPIRRAQYLLKEKGFDIGEQQSKDVPPELLEEVFEFNMALEESDREGIAKARTTFEQMLGTIDEELSAKYLEYDDQQTREILAEIRGLLNRRRYIENLVGKTESVELQAHASAQE